jgi:hypothetical protein
MTDDGAITNQMLLEHMQAGYSSLRSEMRREIGDLKKEFHRLEKKVDRGFGEADRQFKEAKEHRAAQQEDLYATIRMQAAHGRELAVLTGRPEPEDY